MTSPKEYAPSASSASVPELIKLRKVTPDESANPIPVSRPGALGPSGRNLEKMTGRQAAPQSKAPIVDRAQARIDADVNATEMEFESTRLEIEEMVVRSMSAAEAGVTLQRLLMRHPDLLRGQGGRTTLDGGDGGMPREGSIPKRELLPLPLPKVTLVRTSEIEAMFPSGKVLGPKARAQGANAWHYLLVAALNGLDSHGNCVSFFGPPTPAQAAALQKLLVDCERFVADGESRTPIDFSKELGGKLNSYWGEPVYTAQDITLLQVRPTLPAKGVAASVEIVDVLRGASARSTTGPRELAAPGRRMAHPAAKGQNNAERSFGVELPRERALATGLDGLDAGRRDFSP